MYMNVIIDGNFLLFQTLNVIKYINNVKTNDLFVNKKEIEDFKKKFITDLNKILEYPENVERVILCFDSHSWRKQKVLTYKSNRKKDDSEKDGWTRIYKVWDELILELTNSGSETGVFVSRVDQFEGDDLLYFWSKLFYKQNKNTIIVGNDNDLIQLIQFNEETENFVIFLQYIIKNRRLAVPLNIIPFLNKEDDLDTFNLDDLFLDFKTTDVTVSNKIDSIVNKGVNLFTVDPEMLLLNKIILGDASDNINSCYVWEKSNSSFNRVTPSFFNDIKDCEFFTIEKLINGDKELYKYLKVNFEKRSKNSVDINILKENINENILLIYLDYDIYPKELITTITKYFNDITESLKTTPYYNKSKLYEIMDMNKKDYKLEIFA